jgi:transcriptional regulator with XRE-family HTH domain
MLKNFLDQLKDEGPILPNKYTTALGEKIRLARQEREMNQADLAERAYLRQSSISKIETGIRAVSAEEILYLCYALHKPILYFFPKEFRTELDKSDLSDLEAELMQLVRRLDERDLKKLIAQVRAIVDM